MICAVAGNRRRQPFGRCSIDAVAVQSGWIDMKNMDLMHEYPRILWKYMKLRACNMITNLPHKRPKSSEIARFQNFSAWQGQKDLNPRHSVLETDALPTELYPYLYSGFLFPIGAGKADPEFDVVDRQGLEPRTDRL